MSTSLVPVYRKFQPTMVSPCTLGAPCPACRAHGIAGLKAHKLHGFCCRAAHNLWVLLEEEKWLSKHIAKGTYKQNYSRRVDNSTYKPIIDELLEAMASEDE